METENKDDSAEYKKAVFDSLLALKVTPDPSLTPAEVVELLCDEHLYFCR